MTVLDQPILADAVQAPPDTPDGLFTRIRRSRRIRFSFAVLMLILLSSLLTMPLTLRSDHPWGYNNQYSLPVRVGPNFSASALWCGSDTLGRSLIGRCLLGGAASLAIGLAAAVISVTLGVAVGLVAGYRGGWIDALLMRSVDILYGLPYLLLVILFKIAFEKPLSLLVRSESAANFIVLFTAIGIVSWLTMARVVRGQVLFLRSLPFIEACKATGLGQWRIFTRHLLPNLVGPIVVYATLIVPSAILQESFLSFLGIGIQPPLPTWGSLAADGLSPALNPIVSHWWMLVFPCALLAVTLLALNFLGDGLRDLFDPKAEAAKI